MLKKLAMVTLVTLSVGAGLYFLFVGLHSERSLAEKLPILLVGLLFIRLPMLVFPGDEPRPKFTLNPFRRAKNAIAEMKQENSELMSEKTIVLIPTMMICGMLIGLGLTLGKLLLNFLFD